MEENQYELIQKFLENGFEFGLLNHELKDKLLILDNQLSLKSNPETLYYTLNFLKGFDFFFEENTNNCTVKGKLIFTNKKEHEILIEIGLSAFGKGKSIIESVKNGIENLISGNILFEENSKVVIK